MGPSGFVLVEIDGNRTKSSSLLTIYLRGEYWRIEDNMTKPDTPSTEIQEVSSLSINRNGKLEMKLEVEPL